MVVSLGQLEINQHHVGETSSEEISLSDWPICKSEAFSSKVFFFYGKLTILFFFNGCRRAQPTVDGAHPRAGGPGF